MDETESKIVSIHMEPPSFLDKLLRGQKKGDLTYIVEFRHPKYTDYGGHQQKYHQRRYKDFFGACRRLDYMLVKHPDIEKAFILDFPLDVLYYRKRALSARTVCNRCGGHELALNFKDDK